MISCVKQHINHEDKVLLSSEAAFPVQVVRSSHNYQISALALKLHSTVEQVSGLGSLPLEESLCCSLASPTFGQLSFCWLERKAKSLRNAAKRPHIVWHPETRKKWTLTASRKDSDLCVTFQYCCVLLLVLPCSLGLSRALHKEFQRQLL